MATKQSAQALGSTVIIEDEGTRTLAQAWKPWGSMTSLEIAQWDNKKEKVTKNCAVDGKPFHVWTTQKVEGSPFTRLHTYLPNLGKANKKKEEDKVKSVKERLGL